MDIGKVIEIGDRPMEPVIIPQTEPLKPKHEPEVDKPREKEKERI